MEKLEHLSRWYVYELADPRTGCVFYVGKGTKNRIASHEIEAASKPQVCSQKLRKIRDIWAAGFSVDRRFNAFFWDEQAAYDHETEVILSHGLENLTNVLPGGQKAWAERQHQLAMRKAQKESANALESELSRGSSILLERFADWFRFGGHRGVKVNLNFSDPHLKWNAKITEVFYNEFMPRLLREINGSAALREKLVSAMRKYRVELVYGGA